MEHGNPGLIFSLGTLLLAALAMEGLGRRVRIPQVTLLILVGMVVGEPGLDLLPPAAAETWYPVISDLALLIVGFLLGRHLALPVLRRYGRRLLWFSLCAVLGAVGMVALVLVLVDTPLPLALVLAGIAPATAPAAVLNVVEETDARGAYTEIMLGVVAINNALALIAFDLLLAASDTLVEDQAPMASLISGGQALLGAVAIGLGVGLPAGRLMPRVRSGESMELATLGLVLACGGLALWADASYLLAAIALGAALVNSGPRDPRPFETVQQIDWPFLALFFVFTGASSHPEILLSIGLTGILYILSRIAGLTLGTWVGGWLGRAPSSQRRWLGPAILPQAGLALGMAMIAGDHLPEWGDTLMAVVVGSTVLFELVGPILTRVSLSRAGDIPPRSPT